MSKELLSEGFIEKFITLLTKAAVTKKRPKSLATAIKKDPQLRTAFEELESATSRIEAWAEKQRKKDPNFGDWEDALGDLLR